MERFLLISLGAIAGANLRYWVTDWVAQRLGVSFPYGTLIVNLTGCLILGIFVTLITERFVWDPRWRVLVAVGFCGSYTTFSSYALESVNLIFKGDYVPGFIYLIGSSILGVLAILAGIVIGRLV